MGMKHEDQNIALQAIEFWSTVCESELDIEEEVEDVQIHIKCEINKTGHPEQC